MKNSVKSSLYYITTYALAYIIFISFSIYMTQLGYDAMLLATMFSLSSATIMVIRFLIPRLINSGSCRKAVAVSTVTTIVGSAIFLLVPGRSAFRVILYTVLSIGGYQLQIGLTDPWVMRIMETDNEMDFGKVRSFGSISYALTAVIYGWCLSKFGMGIAFWSILVLEAVQLYVAMQIPDEKREGEIESEFKLWKSILTKPSFIAFTLCYLLPAAVYILLDTYMPVLILEKGGTSFHSGLSSFVMASLEFVFLTFYTKIANRLGTRNTIVLGMLGFLVKAFAVALMPTPETVIAACVTQTISFCLFIPSIVRFIQETNRPEESASAYSLLQVIDSLFSTFISNPIAGALKSNIGTGPMLMIFGVLSAVSGAVFYLITEKNKGLMQQK